MIDKKTLKSILSFTENQTPAPSFILIYILTWLAWHNQLFSNFIDAQGDFLTRVTTSFSSMEENQYLVVFFITCLIILVRLAFHYFSFRSRELLNSSDDIFESMRDDQKFAKDSDIGKLMESFSKTKQQLVDAKVKEKEAIADKNETIKKLLSLQHELDEARADIEVLTKAQSL